MVGGTVTIVMTAYALSSAVGKPLLTKGINPHRHTWLASGISLTLAAFTVLRWEAKSSSLTAIIRVVEPLVTDERTPTHVFIATFALVNGALIVICALYCYIRIPRDPSSFKPDSVERSKIRSQLRRVIKHYTSRRGGLEYACLIVLPGKAASPRAEDIVFSDDVMVNGAAFAVDYQSKSEVRASARRQETTLRTPEEFEACRRRWVEIALQSRTQQELVTEATRAGHLGRPKEVMITTEFGAVLVGSLYPGAMSADGQILIVGVTLSAYEVANRRFEDHFGMLRQASLLVVPQLDLLLPKG